MNEGMGYQESRSPSDCHTSSRRTNVNTFNGNSITNIHNLFNRQDSFCALFITFMKVININGPSEITYYIKVHYICTMCDATDYNTCSKAEAGLELVTNSIFYYNI